MFDLRILGAGRACLAGTAFAAFALASLALAPALSQAASWSIQTTPNGTGAEHSALYDMACEPASTSVCTAVGKQTIGGATSPYAQYWNGSTWENQSAETPAGATAGELQSNHCLSKTSCVAAGSYATKSGTFSLIESWNGTKWSVQTTPNPEGATQTLLKGISCKVITACIAVGYTNAGGKWATALRGNSGTWSLQTVPKPAGAISSELNGVECTSSTSCVAVGTYNTGASTYWAMAATWNGTEWSLQTVPKPPAEAKRSVLLDVSCSDGANCTAVGGLFNKSFVQETFVVRWNGTSWTQQTSPNPGGSSNSVLQNISCTDRYSCVAVGDWLNAEKKWQPMAQSWNSNSGWTLDSAANPAGATFTVLEGVACRFSCQAIGWYTDSEGKNKTLGEAREIPSWTQQTVPEASTVNRLEGVSCVTGPACVAVGYEQHAGPKDVARTFVWNGSSWSASGKPAPAGAIHSRLLDVSCTSSSACTAVGYYYNEGGVEKPWAARYSSGSWTAQTVPLPAEVIRGRLDDVSCTSSTSCRAVGERGTTKLEGDGPLTVVWNGTSWSVETNAAGEYREFHSISCTSTTACMATGTEDSGDILVEKWNGTSWSAVTDPAGPLVTFAVSCTSSSECTVAGWGGTGYPSVSRWNGATWSELPGAPALSFAELSYFEDISCTSSSSCFAVGRLHPNTFLAAKWDGTAWTLHSVPKPAAGYLAGVSCLSSTSCHAVGSTSTEAVAESFP